MSVPRPKNTLADKEPRTRGRTQYLLDLAELKWVNEIPLRALPLFVIKNVLLRSLDKLYGGIHLFRVFFFSTQRVTTRWSTFRMGWEASILACRIPSLPAAKLQVHQGWVATPARKHKNIFTIFHNCFIELVSSDASGHLSCAIVVWQYYASFMLYYAS